MNLKKKKKKKVRKKMKNDARELKKQNDERNVAGCG